MSLAMRNAALSQLRPTFSAMPVMHSRKTCAVRAYKEDNPKPSTSTGIPDGKDIDDSVKLSNKDSFQRIEEPARGRVAPDGGPPLSERQTALDKLLVDQDSANEQQFLGTAVAFPDAMRFKGAAPEVINSRLAMLGFVLAVGLEAITGKNVIEQVQSWPLATAAVFGTFIVASLIPILRGVPRKDGLGPFTAKAEILNGRVAMVGFTGLVLQEAIRFWLARG